MVTSAKERLQFLRKREEQIRRGIIKPATNGRGRQRITTQKEKAPSRLPSIEEQKKIPSKIERKFSIIGSGGLSYGAGFSDLAGVGRIPVESDLLTKEQRESIRLSKTGKVVVFSEKLKGKKIGPIVFRGKETAPPTIHLTETLPQPETPFEKALFHGTGILGVSAAAQSFGAKGYQIPISKSLGRKVTKTTGVKLSKATAGKQKAFIITQTKKVAPYSEIRQGLSGKVEIVRTTPKDTFISKSAVSPTKQFKDFLVQEAKTDVRPLDKTVNIFTGRARNIRYQVGGHAGGGQSFPAFQKSRFAGLSKDVFKIETPKVRITKTVSAGKSYTPKGFSKGMFGDISFDIERIGKVPSVFDDIGRGVFKGTKTISKQQKAVSTALEAASEHAAKTISKAKAPATPIVPPIHIGARTKPPKPMEVRTLPTNIITGGLGLGTITGLGTIQRNGIGKIDTRQSITPDFVPDVDIITGGSRRIITPKIKPIPPKIPTTTRLKPIMKTEEDILSKSIFGTRSRVKPLTTPKIATQVRGHERIIEELHLPDVITGSPTKTKAPPRTVPRLAGAPAFPRVTRGALPFALFGGPRVPKGFGYGKRAFRRYKAKEVSIADILLGDLINGEINAK